MMGNYYDKLAPYYKYIYVDWEKSVRRQAEMLDSVFKDYLGGNIETILDVSCGIGTQSIGLAEIGYKVTACDISSSEIHLAQEEAKARGLEIDFQVGDMRKAWDTHHHKYDVVIACDNSVPHLLSNEEILLAFQQFYRCTAKGGACVISVRDYANMERPESKILMHPRLIHQTGDEQVILFDVWKFDGDYYEITTYIILDTGAEELKTHVAHGGKYYCVSISTLEELLRKAGYKEIHTSTDRFFQPLLIAKKN